MSAEYFLYEVEGEIGILTLNRPKVVNAVNSRMLEELNQFWQERQEDTDVRVIILRGAGEKGFCSGVDTKETSESLGNLSPGTSIAEYAYNIQKRWSSVIRLMRTCPQPIIAAIHGPAMGGGLAFASAADVRLASEDAMFCAQYINIGLGGADVGSSYFLWRIVGCGRAAEMCLTGAQVFAEEAYRIGLVNHLHSREDLMPAALEMANVMVGKTKLGLRLTKDALNAGLNLSSLEDAVKVEDRNQVFLALSGGLKPAPKRGDKR
jgi:enoyl-CoA hydratase/carnithine racemase